MGRPTHQNPARNTVAILGDSPVVCRAIAYILEVGGYETRIVEATLDEAALSDVDLVLVAAGRDLGGWGPLNLEGTVPVLKLVDTREEKETVGERGILWPCTARALQTQVFSAISIASADDVPLEDDQKPHEYGVSSSN